jgi:thymidine phosphorylase
VGRGAVLPTEEAVRGLAGLLNRIGRAAGVRTAALLTRMDQPLGRAVGNGPEVAEAIGCLKGEGPEDLLEVTLALGERMLVLAGAAGDVKEARRRLEEALRSGAGLRCFRDMVRRQGGREEVVDDPGQLPQASRRLEIKSPGKGYIGGVDALAVGRAAVRLGAGRLRLDDRVDHAVGVLIHKKAGDEVSPGETVAEVLAADEERGRRAVEEVRRAVVISEQRPEVPSLVADVIEPDDEQPGEDLYR